MGFLVQTDCTPPKTALNITAATLVRLGPGYVFTFVVITGGATYTIGTLLLAKAPLDFGAASSTSTSRSISVC